LGNLVPPFWVGSAMTAVNVAPAAVVAAAAVVVAVAVATCGRHCLPSTPI